MEAEGGGVGIGPGGRVTHIASAQEINNLPLMRYKIGMYTPEDSKYENTVDIL